MIPREKGWDDGGRGLQAATGNEREARFPGRQQVIRDMLGAGARNGGKTLSVRGQRADLGGKLAVVFGIKTGKGGDSRDCRGERQGEYG